MKKNVIKKDVIIIGGGVAGLMCANELSDFDTLVLEKKNLGTKLLLTGNGRCNLTSNISNDVFLNNVYNKKFFYSAINLFGPSEVINFFSSIKLSYEGDKVFTKSGNASDILDKLKKIDYSIENVLKIFNMHVYTDKNIYLAKYIVIAIGGHSYRFTGCGDVYNFSNFLNQPITKLYPVEGSLITSGYSSLAGTSFDDVTIKVLKKNFRGTFLFTHTGLSGSSVMDACEYIARENVKKISVDFSNSVFSKKFLKFMNDKKELEFDVSCCDINRAFVTGGGFDLSYINTKTFESKINKKIFFVGECLDVHGPIGGFNITLALSTGFSAATYIKDCLKK